MFSSHFPSLAPFFLFPKRGLVQNPETEAKKRTQRFSEVRRGEIHGDLSTKP